MLALRGGLVSLGRTNDAPHHRQLSLISQKFKKLSPAVTVCPIIYFYATNACWGKCPKTTVPLNDSSLHFTPVHRISSCP